MQEHVIITPIVQKGKEKKRKSVISSAFHIKPLEAKWQKLGLGQTIFFLIPRLTLLT
jgi:hypothetical protein